MSNLTNKSDSESNSESSEERLVTGALNYLRWFEAEDIGPNLGMTLNADTALEWFCRTIPHRPLLDALRRRYEELKGLDNQLFFVPIEHPSLVEKILIPLHQAKVAFVLGHEFGCIALCGMVGEMLAILRFHISAKPLTNGQQRRLFGQSFEQLQHSRRIGFLELMGIVDGPTADLFRELSKLRNKYLHRLSQPHTTMPKDAIRAYEISAKLAIAVCGLGLKDSRITISSELHAFIKAGGFNSEGSGESRTNS